jgi:HEAT repeat protein
MQSVLGRRPERQQLPVNHILVRMGILGLPAVILLVGCLRNQGVAHRMLWLGAAVEILLGCLFVLHPRTWRQPLGPPIILLYLVGFCWLWLVGDLPTDWFTRTARTVLLLVPLLVFALLALRDSGALAYRRARVLAQRLARRKTWPDDLTECRTLPEVRALRQALSIDASPALALLGDHRPEVRIAALSALEFRKNWRRGQADLVLILAQRSQEPVERAAAVMALGQVNDQRLVEALAEFLRDIAWEVRRAASEALLWDSEKRWSWIRHAVRRALGDPVLQGDGPLRHNGPQLSPEAVADLTAWSGEKGCLGDRAAWTLGVHFSRMLSDHPGPELIEDLKHRLADVHTGPALRVELAQLLRANDELDRTLLEQLLDATSPAPLRLLAAEALLSEGRHFGAMVALRDIARLPNREIALNTADVVQRRLGVDLGLALGQPLPQLHSRLAAEVTRRVMVWAAQAEAELPGLWPVGSGLTSGVSE